MGADAWRELGVSPFFVPLCQGQKYVHFEYPRKSSRLGIARASSALRSLLHRFSPRQYSSKLGTALGLASVQDSRVAVRMEVVRDTVYIERRDTVEVQKLQGTSSSLRSARPRTCKMEEVSGNKGQITRQNCTESSSTGGILDYKDVFVGCLVILFYVFFRDYN